MLSRPSSLLRPPPTPSRLPATSRCAVMGRHASRPPQGGAEEGLSSSHDNLLTVPRPLRRRVLRHPLQGPWCLPWPSPPQVQARLPLGPACAGILTTLQASLDVADRSFASAPLRRRPLDRRRGLRYRGPWRLPGPGFHRLATVSFSLGYVRSRLCSSMSWRPNCWTHTYGNA